MENKEKLELLGRAFAYGEIDELSKYLHKDCRYNSDYAQKHYTTADKIIESMQTVIENVRKATDRDSSYTYKTIKLSEVFNEGIDLDDLHGDTFFDVFEYGLLLYQFGDPAPVSVVFVKFNPGGYISEINLSRNRKWFDLQFYGTQDLSDSEKDVPYTVKPMTVHDRQVKEMQAGLIRRRTMRIWTMKRSISGGRQTGSLKNGWTMVVIMSWKQKYLTIV